jgi:hypothetical protein
MTNEVNEMSAASRGYAFSTKETDMTKIELLQMLTDIARDFRNDADHYQRNAHMHTVTECPPQDVIDTILTGFINRVGTRQGVDYALYESDLAAPKTPALR